MSNSLNWDKEELAKKLQENPDFLKVNVKEYIPPFNLEAISEHIDRGFLEVLESSSDASERKNKGIKDSVSIKHRTTNKYHVSEKAARTYNGITYHSKKEMEFAQQLDLRQKAGEIDFWLRQVPFRLPGGTVYRLDFMTFRGNLRHPHAISKEDRLKILSWSIHFIEVKGQKLRLGELKRKQTEELYHIKIEVV